MLKIDITHLKPGLYEYEMEPAPEELELDPETFRDLHVDVRMDYSGDRALVNIDASATATLECDRTLQIYSQPISGTFAVLYAPPEMLSEVDEEMEDMRVLHPSDQEIDLTGAVRDTLMLAVPARRLAPGAEDIDIQTSFGSSADQEGERIDPRWEVLRKLRSGENE